MRCFKKKGPDRQPSFVLGSQYPAIQYPQAISQDIHPSIHCSIYCYYESPIWPICLVCQHKPIPTKLMDPKLSPIFTGGFHVGFHHFREKNTKMTSRTRWEEKFTEILQILEFCTLESNYQTTLTGDGHRRENQSCRYQYGVYLDIPIFFLRNVWYVPGGWIAGVLFSPWTLPFLTKVTGREDGLQMRHARFDPSWLRCFWLQPKTRSSSLLSW